jgi:hypothetical protein
LILLMGCAQQAPPSSAPPAPSPSPQPAPSPQPPAVNNTPPPTNQSPTINQSMNQTANQTPPSMNQSNGTSMNSTTNNTHMNNTPPPPPPPPPMPTSYSVDANDGGFYMNGGSITSLSVPKGVSVTIKFNVLTTEVYHGGLDFRGCGQSTAGTSPGQSVDFQFTPQSSCGITSYWPSTGVAKRTLQISPQ